MHLLEGNCESALGNSITISRTTKNFFRLCRVGYYLWSGPRTDDGCALYDPCEAVDLLNAGRELPKVIRCLEALDHLRRSVLRLLTGLNLLRLVEECKQCIERLSDAGWCQLALQGSTLCSLLKGKSARHTPSEDEHEIDQLLSEVSP